MIIQAVYGGHNQKGRFYIGDAKNTIFCEEFEWVKGRKYMFIIEKTWKYGNKTYYESIKVTETDLEEAKNNDNSNVFLQKYIDEKLMEYENKIKNLEKKIEELQNINGILTDKERENKVDTGEFTIDYSKLVKNEEIIEMPISKIDDEDPRQD